ncbi:MAG: multidrug DMT transporter permease [Bacteroidaceae bacterium]|nr:multidrug DMT transporter permease [Bacteroidaceae bacterium]
MFIVTSSTLAVVLCVVTMLCWGSWGNTQKLAGKSWRYELFYWDYIVGILLFSLVVGLTLGSNGEAGRPFLEDLGQVSCGRVGSAILGGVIFNAANILLTAAVSISGLAIAWPIGLGIALVLGVFLNYLLAPNGNPYLLALGVALVLGSVICNGVASGKNSKVSGNGISKKGLAFTIVSGFLMGIFYPFVAYAMDLNSCTSPAEGMATPYTAFFLCAVGAFLSNFVFNTILMKRPISGEPVTYKQYFAGNLPTHLVGVLGGCVWGLGTVLSYICSGKEANLGPAISYALGQGSPMIAALWGIFIWKEFKGSNAAVKALLVGMFIAFIIGVATIIMARS